MYASGHPTKDPDVLTYHLTQVFHCLPSQLESEDADLLERLLLINTAIESHNAKKMEEVSHAPK